MGQLVIIVASALALISVVIAYRRPTLPHMFAAAATNAIVAYFLLS